MGSHIEKQRISYYQGFRASDRVSHRKLGSSIGTIQFFASFLGGTFALVDYGKRKRFERVEDLMPLRNDIYEKDCRSKDEPPE